MKVLLTGYQGFIGKNFLEKMPNGWEVKLHEWGDRFPNVEGLDWVFHIGAISSTTENNLDKVMEQNFMFSVKLFESCVMNNVNFQWSSSASVYGKNNTTFSESDVPEPANLYAMSKYLLEEYIKKRNVDNITWQGFRYFNVFGPHEDHKGSQASPIHQFTKQAKENKIIKIFEGSDFFTRDFVHVDKVIDTHIKMTKAKKSGIWNVGSGSSVSFREVANIIAKKHDARIKEIPFPENLKQHYQEYTNADTTKLNETMKMIESLENYQKIGDSSI